MRAYCEKNGAYRDFVLSRLRGEPDVLDISEFSREADTGWNTRVNVIIEPDQRLTAEQKRIIEIDYGMQNGQLIVPSRGALVQYVLQRFQIDANKVESKASAQQIVVANLDALQPWLYH